MHSPSRTLPTLLAAAAVLAMESAGRNTFLAYCHLLDG